MNPRRLMGFSKGRRCKSSTFFVLRVTWQEAVHVRFGSKADICGATSHVRFIPNCDRKSGYLRFVMSALPPRADMCSALAHVRFGPIADSCTAANRTLNRPPHQRARRRCRGRCPIALSSGRSPIKAVAAGQGTPTDCKPSHSESALTRPESFTWEIPVKVCTHAAQEILR